MRLLTWDLLFGLRPALAPRAPRAPHPQTRSRPLEIRIPQTINQEYSYGGLSYQQTLSFRIAPKTMAQQERTSCIYKLLTSEARLTKCMRNPPTSSGHRSVFRVVVIFLNLLVYKEIELQPFPIHSSGSCRWRAMYSMSVLTQTKRHLLDLIQLLL